MPTTTQPVSLQCSLLSINIFLLSLSFRWSLLFYRNAFCKKDRLGKRTLFNKSLISNKKSGERKWKWSIPHKDCCSSNSWSLMCASGTVKTAVHCLLVLSCVYIKNRYLIFYVATRVVMMMMPMWWHWRWGQWLQAKECTRAAHLIFDLWSHALLTRWQPLVHYVQFHGLHFSMHKYF